MGQKTHPTGFRVGVIRNWASTWYAKWKDYGVCVKEDDSIRKFVKKRLYAAGVSRILIDRKAQNTTITVVTAKPGIVVGRGGQGIDELRQEVTKFIGKPLSSFSNLSRFDVNAIALNKVLVHSPNNLLGHILGHLYKGKLVININQTNIARRNICLDSNGAHNILHHNLLAATNIQDRKSVV